MPDSSVSFEFYLPPFNKFLKNLYLSTDELKSAFFFLGKEEKYWLR